MPGHPALIWATGIKSALGYSIMCGYMAAEAIREEIIPESHQGCSSVNFEFLTFYPTCGIASGFTVAPLGNGILVLLFSACLWEIVFSWYV